MLLSRFFKRFVRSDSGSLPIQVAVLASVAVMVGVGVEFDMGGLLDKFRDAHLHPPDQEITTGSIERLEPGIPQINIENPDAHDLVGLAVPQATLRYQRDDIVNLSDNSRPRMEVRWTHEGQAFTQRVEAAPLMIPGESTSVRIIVAPIDLFAGTGALYLGSSMYDQTFATASSIPQPFCKYHFANGRVNRLQACR